jgi:RND family efflux transporter MFP subunit
VLIELSAPEMNAQIAEAQAKVQAAAAERLQAEAQLTAVESTHERLKRAAETPGAVAGNELVLAQKQVESARALAQSKREAQAAAESMVRAQKDLEAYLHIRAPFGGIITERFVHPGALVGPNSDSPLLVLQEVARLRLVIPVPEENVGTIVRGRQVTFHVPSNPGRAFHGTVSRIAHSLDPKTRTMAVEADVTNTDGSLSPGMYPSVSWSVQQRRPSLLVPKTAVVSTSERTFVVRRSGGRAEWVDVVKGIAEGDSVEVRGNLRAGDSVVARATDEIREGTTLQ